MITRVRRPRFQTIDHVRERGSDHPVAVGNLWRAKSRIDAHLGETDLVRVGAAQSLAALTAGLGEDDPRVLAQRIEVGDALVQIGRPRQGLAAYAGVASRARRLGDKQLEGFALLRMASLWATASGVRQRSATAEAEARKAIGRVMAIDGPAFAPFREAADLLAARLDALHGDHGAVDRVIARYRERATERPLLIHTPSIDPFSTAGAPVAVSGSTGASSTRAFEDQWVDVSFQVAPDGSVKDADVIRGSDRLNPVWVEPVLKMVRGRRYAPLKSVAAASPGLLRVERITYTSDYFVPTGTRLRVRSGSPRIVITDMSVDPPRSPTG